VDPGAHDPTLSDSFRRIVLQCLVKEPDGRFQSASALGLALSASEATAPGHRSLGSPVAGDSHGHDAQTWQGGQQAAAVPSGAESSHTDAPLSAWEREHGCPRLPYLPRFDMYITLIVAVILTTVSVTGGIAHWGGRAVVMPLVFFVGIPVYAIVEGVRLRPVLAIALAAFVGALPAVSLLFYEAPRSEAQMFGLVMPGGAAAIAAITCLLAGDWARNRAVRAATGCALLALVVIAIGVSGAIVWELTSSRLAGFMVVLPPALLRRWWFRRGRRAKTD
jgi:hypothetical protein